MPRLHLAPKLSVPMIYYTTFSSPIGRIGIAATPRGLCRISLNATSPPAFRKTLRRDYRCSAVRRDRLFTDLLAWMRAYFLGRPVRFKLKIDLQEGTPFQHKVWRSLLRIPYGQTQSYQDVARDIGHPNSFRAVGGACGNNPIALIVPCHRVINANGKLGGFTGGLRLKKLILKMEKERSLRINKKRITHH
ncbi:MAG: methylated-DNA--[protein]-cysteine S-methyltransferase [Nitrospirae bacterium]|nr:methylated-DNA--[protein]-cysteine S-methyltransferase [Nitrospirota bacterium]